MSDKLQLVLDSAEAVQAFKEHCYADLYLERCGLFVINAGAVTFVPCDNNAYDKKNSFLIHPADFVAAADVGDVIAVGHSHVVGTAKPTNEDKINSENCKLPFVIFQPEANVLETYDPTGMPVDLIGRSWTLGVSDCYTLARDYYKMFGVELQDYMRNSADILKSRSLFLEHFAENGFHEVEGPPKMHDGLLMNVLADIPNHCAIMVSDNLILHHLQHRLSCREPYAGYWRRHTTKILRHEKWL